MRKFFILLGILGLLVSCSQYGSGLKLTEGLRVVPRETVATRKIHTEKKVLSENASTTKTKTEVVFETEGKPTEVLFTNSRSYQRGKHQLSVEFDSLPLQELVVRIFRDTLKKNFVIEGKIPLTVTASIDGNFTERDLVGCLDSILNDVGFSITQKEGIYVIKKRQPQSSVVSSKGVSFWIFSPRYLSPKDAYNLVLGLVSKSGKVKLLSKYILVSDTKDNLIGIRNLIRSLDISAFNKYSLKIFKLKYSDPSDVEKDVGNILKRMGIDHSNYSLVSIDRLSLLVALASSQELMSRMEALIKLFDSEEAHSERGVYIYRVQYVKVDKIAKTLEGLITGRAKIATKDKKKGAKSTTNYIFSSKVSVIPDETNNALIIEASPEDYRKLKAIISELDSMPKQVLIEVLVAEVTLNDQFENGVEWWLKTHGKYEAEFSSSFGLSGNRDKLFGLTFYGIKPDDFWNFLYFISTKSKITILSSPHILVRDNEEASIDVGQEVPILTMETVGNTQIQGSTAIDRRIEYRDVGVILRVKPHISEEGFVTLEITQETSAAEKNTVSGIDSPVILKRKVKTTLMVQNEHTVILGGIINRKQNELKKRVPLLGDIPVLGKFFSYKSQEKERTELIIMITPHVIRDITEADVISSVFENRLKKLLSHKKK